MSIQREEVSELRPVGERVWLKCDGCGKKSESGHRRFEPGETRRPLVTINPPPGWITVSTPYNVCNDVAGESAHACERCKEMPASRLLEMAGIEG